MSDRYTQFANSPLGRMLAKNFGLPMPVHLDRFEPGAPVIAGAVLFGTAAEGKLTSAISGILKNINANVFGQGGKTAAGDEQKYKALVFDASGIKDSADLMKVYQFFHPVMRKTESCARVIVIGTPPEACESPRHATAQRALEGFTRSMGKEIKKGGTANLVYVAPGAENQLESTLRFFLSPRSAYVSAQVARVTPNGTAAQLDWNKPLAGKVALVTGASRGIGEAIAKTLARDGAHVVGLDIPQLGDDLKVVANLIGGSALAVDITAADAPQKIADYLKSNHGGVDIIVHNAGVTRDKTLANMTDQQWNMVMNINLSSEERINDELLAQGVIRDNGRIVCVSSISGIAGNMGQTNYAMSKAGVIGMVQSMAKVVGGKNITINAVAPGFIETAMTAAIPFAIREAGRRMNSMAQGGLPVDVAEAIAWYASPASAGLNGNVVRVCGQSLIGA
ncbi:MAG: fabG [Moraxellaceae bacterium]|jgi:3-oxoacyl-[acyl-carrier protein] reductase|nr:fabG [Moraxellaceae bacterium]